MDTTKRVQRTINLPNNTWLKLDEIRNATGLSTTAIIAVIINQYVNGHEKII